MIGAQQGFGHPRRRLERADRWTNVLDLKTVIVHPHLPVGIFNSVEAKPVRRLILSFR